MRFIKRTTATPPTLAPNGKGYEKGISHLSWKKTDVSADLSFPDYWNEPDVRGALYAMHGPTCAYCGCHLPRNDRGDVEHFRPLKKVHDHPAHGGYWWLAYDFSNYLLSCSVCNRQIKKTKFPFLSGAGPCSYNKKDCLADEEPLLLNPTVDDVDSILEPDIHNDLAPLQPARGVSGKDYLRAESSIEFFRLNRNIDLAKERLDLIDSLIEALENDEGDRAGQMAVRYRTHSIVAKRILDELHPRLLPTPEQELNWLLAWIMKRFDLTLKLMERFPEDDKLEKQAKELLWSFAVIWKDPPAGTPEEIEAYLSVNGVIDEVRELFDQFS